MIRSPGANFQPNLSTDIGGFGFNTAWSSRLRLRAPRSPRIIGQSTCTSLMGSSPNRRGMRSRTISTIFGTPSSGVAISTMKKSLLSPAFGTSGISPRLIRWALTMIRLAAAQVTSAGDRARQRQLVLVDDRARVPVAGRPVLDAPADALEIDRSARQRRGRELLNRGGERVTPQCQLLVPIRRLLPGQPVRQYGFRQEAPHRAADQGAVGALGKILLRRDAEAIRNEAEICRRIARLDAVHPLLGREPVAEIVDPLQRREPLAAAAAVEKIVARRGRALLHAHRRREGGPDCRMLLPGCGAPGIAQPVKPVAERL